MIQYPPPNIYIYPFATVKLCTLYLHRPNLFSISESLISLYFTSEGTVYSHVSFYTNKYCVKEIDKKYNLTPSTSLIDRRFAVYSVVIGLVRLLEDIKQIRLSD